MSPGTISRLPPILVFVFYLVMIALWAYMAAANQQSVPAQFWLGSLFGFLASAVHVAWVHGVYKKSVETFGQPARSGAFIASVSLIAIVLVLRALKLDHYFVSEIITLTAAGFFFAAIFIAAKGVARARSGLTDFGLLFRTFLLLAYLPIGVWFLPPRFERVTHT